MRRIVKYLAKHFPFLGAYKRYFVALRDALFSIRETYSQHGEDKIIAKIIDNHKNINGIYIDVGANHPTDISNTYLLYRKGFNGICIEPNKALIPLHKKFRKRDVALICGASSKCGLMPFYISNTPVLSSFEEKLQHDGQVLRMDYVPVLTIDQIANLFPDDYVLLLSIDVEGWDFEVLQGSTKTLTRTLCVCIEANTPEEYQKISSFLVPIGFEIKAQTASNIIFENIKI